MICARGGQGTVLALEESLWGEYNGPKEASMMRSRYVVVVLLAVVGVEKRWSPAAARADDLARGPQSLEVKARALFALGRVDEAEAAIRAVVEPAGGRRSLHQAFSLVRRVDCTESWLPSKRTAPTSSLRL